MLQTIYKYALYDSVTTLALPERAEVLTVQMQGSTPTMWVKVNPGALTEDRVFRICATGQKLLSNEMLKYIATIQNGPYIFHVFEVIR